MLYRTISKTNINEKKSEEIKLKDNEIEILSNSLEGIKVKEKDFLHQMGELFKQYANMA
jgi:hypothetical protein